MFGVLFLSATPTTQWLGRYSRHEDYDLKARINAPVHRMVRRYRLLGRIDLFAENRKGHKASTPNNMKPSPTHSGSQVIALYSADSPLFPNSMRLFIAVTKELKGGRSTIK